MGQYSNLYGTLNTRTQSDTYLSQSIKVGSGFGITNLQERFRRMWLTNEIIASKIPICCKRDTGLSVIREHHRNPKELYFSSLWWLVYELSYENHFRRSNDRKTIKTAVVSFITDQRLCKITIMYTAA